MCLKDKLKAIKNRIQEESLNTDVISLMLTYEELASAKLDKRITIFNRYTKLKTKNYKYFERLYDFLEDHGYPLLGYLKAQFAKDYSNYKLPFISSLRSNFCEQNYVDYVAELKHRGCTSIQLDKELKGKVSYKKLLKSLYNHDKNLVLSICRGRTVPDTWENLLELHINKFSIAVHYNLPIFKLLSKLYYTTTEAKNQMKEFIQHYKIGKIRRSDLDLHIEKLEKIFKENKPKITSDNINASSISDVLNKYKIKLITMYKIEGSKEIIKFVKRHLRQVTLSDKQLKIIERFTKNIDD